VRAARLRHWVALEQRVESANDTGEVVWTWEEVCKIWAEIAPVSGREVTPVSEVQAQATHAILIRWRSGVTAKMRIVEICEPSVQYDIQVPLANARRTEIKLMCVTRDADGWRG
jgi:SPP1 family predicted phage head-tail adaptor